MFERTDLLMSQEGWWSAQEKEIVIYLREGWGAVLSTREESSGFIGDSVEVLDSRCWKWRKWGTRLSIMAYSMWSLNQKRGQREKGRSDTLNSWSIHSVVRIRTLDNRCWKWRETDVELCCSPVDTIAWSSKIESWEEEEEVSIRW